MQINKTNSSIGFGAAFARVRLSDIRHLPEENTSEAMKILAGNLGKAVRVFSEQAPDMVVIASEKDGQRALFCPQHGRIGVQLTATPEQEDTFIKRLNTLLGAQAVDSKIVSSGVEEEKSSMLNWLIGKK